MSDPAADFDDLPPDQQALMEAAASLLLPLARLSVARGVRFSMLEEALKQAFVQAAREANTGGQANRQVSRISTTTGIHRREVTRLVQHSSRVARPRRSLAGQLYAHWLSNPVYRDLAGQPLALPRQGDRPSFETLAREITSDVHPRSLLDEMLRLGYAELDEAQQTVRALPDALVPKGNLPRALRILGDNVGNHLAAAAVNVLGEQPVHFEKAIVATGVPAADLVTVRKLVEAQWRQAFDSLVPALERLIEAGRSAAPAAQVPGGPVEPPRQRVLIGLYTHHQADAASAEPEPAPAAGPTPQTGDAR